MNKKYKTSQIVGLFAGLVVALVLWFADITPGLQVEGRRFLGLVLCSVIWWSTKPVGPMFTGTMLLIVTAIANLAPMSSILTLTSGSTFFTYFVNDNFWWSNFITDSFNSF